MSRLLTFAHGADQRFQGTLDHRPFSGREMLGDVGEQRGPGGGDLFGHVTSKLRQVQTQHPPIDGVAPSLDPAPPLEIGDQPADRALLELQSRSELALG